MNFADAFQNFLSKITGQTDRIESATTKLENALGTLSEVTTENTRLKAENETLTNSLKDAPTLESVTSLTTARNQAVSRAEKAENALKTFEAENPGKVTAEANTVAVRAVASAGHEPLAVTVDSGAPGATQASNPNLKGRDRMAAAFKTQIAGLAAKK